MSELKELLITHFFYARKHTNSGVENDQSIWI